MRYLSPGAREALIGIFQRLYKILPRRRLGFIPYFGENSAAIGQQLTDRRGNVFGSNVRKARQS